MTELSLKVERTIKAPKEDVFNAWLEPEMLRQFMMPADGMSVPTATNDAAKGGRFEIVMRAGENDMPHAGTYLEISPHDRIVFTWESPFSADDSTVTITFAAAEGGTHVTLSQVRFENEEKRDNHKGGWESILAHLETTIAA